MDQATIATPGLKLRRRLMDRWPEKLQEVMRTAGRFQINHNSEREALWASIKLGPNFATQVNLRKRENDWYVTRTKTNFPHWIWGHNGRVISDHETFLTALQRYFTVTSLLVDPSDAHRLLPGLGESNESYWESIEVPLHVPDADGRLLTAFRNVRHPRVEREPSLSPGSIKLSGYLFSFKAYDKLAYFKTRFSEAELTGSTRFARLECRFTREGLDEYLYGGKRPGNSDIDRPHIRHPETFCLRTLQGAMKKVLNELEGVFVPSAPVTGTDAVQRLLAAIARMECIPLERLATIYGLTAGRKKRTIKQNIRKAAELYAQFNGFSLQELLTRADDSLGIDVKLHKREENSWISHSMPIDPELRAVYLDEDSDASLFWRPTVGLPFNWPDDLNFYTSGGRETIYEEGLAPQG